MLEIEAFHLKNTKFKESYMKECHDGHEIYHLTFTLNPALNNADILTQYRLAIKEIKSSNIFYYKNNKKDTYKFTIHPGFYRLMLVPELTKTINIHFHGILKIAGCEYKELIQNIKSLCWHSKILGRQFTINRVNDTFKDRSNVAEYAFKDIEQLSKFPMSDKMYLYDFQKII